MALYFHTALVLGAGSGAVLRAPPRFGPLLPENLRRQSVLIELCMPRSAHSSAVI